MKWQVKNVLVVIVKEIGKMALEKRAMVWFKDTFAKIVLLDSVIKHIRRICLIRIANYALVEEAKKLEPVTETKTVTSDEKDVKGKIIQHHVELKLDGYKDSTIRLSKSALNTLINKGADLTNPQTVKKVISEQNWSGNRKRNVINAYSKLLDFIGLTWKPPSYEIIRKIPFIPTEQEIDDLI
ncbi:MAG TPA: hypothetical protein VJY36_02575, partial [Candidatus Bathyarchaeia archaeon]|nr:hypothetical protein [Candidatus Bathyarchaeia archaeon]